MEGAQGYLAVIFILFLREPIILNDDNIVSLLDLQILHDLPNLVLQPYALLTFS